MAEYIDLDTPLEVKVTRGNTYKPYTSTLRELLDVNHIPYTAANVRPVVLCRDCQYFENDCGWCGYFDIGMNVNDFCSHGKREES